MSNLIQTSRSISFARYPPALITLLLGLCLAVWAGQNNYHAEYHRLESQFSNMSDDVSDRIYREIARDIDALYPIKSFFEASGFVDRSGFKTFAYSILHRYPSLESLEWIPKVRPADKIAFETSKRSEVRSFLIRDVPGIDNASTAHSPENDIYPVTYIEPPTRPNLSALGLNYASDPERRSAMEKATKNRKSTSTNLILLTRYGKLSNSISPKGFIAFVPVYSRQEESSEQPENQILVKGFIAGTFRAPIVVEQALRQLSVPGIDIEIQSESSKHVYETVFEKKEPLLASPPLPLPSFISPVMKWQRTFNISGGNWKIITRSNPKYPTHEALSHGAIAFSIVFLVTCLIAFYFYLIVAQKMSENWRASSMTDELTRLYNRRGFMLLAEQQRKFNVRRKKGFHVLLLDLDGFKTINDTYGHSEGDDALKKSAALLRSVFRGSDIIGRIGGDEFSIMTPDTQPEDGILIKLKLQRAFDDHNAQSHKPYTLKCSIGTAYAVPGNEKKIDVLLSEADEAMYLSKKIRRINY